MNEKNVINSNNNKKEKREEERKMGRKTTKTKMKYFEGNRERERE